jgi:nitrogenase molybdenum-iron protein NifN
MRPAAEALAARTGVPSRLFPTATGLEAVDTLVATLMEISGQAPSERIKRERSRLVDAMLDSHFPFGEAAIAIAAEPDLLLALATLVASVGGRISAAVTTTATGPAAASLDRVPAAAVLVGDLDDFEAAAGTADLLLANAHAQPIARRLGRPLARVGFPIFDRIGQAHAVSVGYRGSRQLLFSLANQLLDQAERDPHPAAVGHDVEAPGRRASHA